MAKGTEDQLDELHRLVTEDLIDRVKNGEIEVTREGEKVRVPTSAAVLAQAIKFLQSQGIEAAKTPAGKARLKGLLDSLPFPQGDDPDAPPATH